MSVTTRPFVVKAYTRKELREMYGVSVPTFRKWLKRIPGFTNFDDNTFTPKEVQQIIDHLNTP